MENLVSNAEKMALNAVKMESFKGFDLANAKDKLAKMLSHIGTNGMFCEYTKHDITHIDGMLGLVDCIVPCTVKDIMTSADWLMIVLSVYFHDLGMLITNAEWDNRNNNSDFKKFCASKTVDMSSCDEGNLKQYYQDYVRLNHGERIFSWINTVSCKSDSDNPVVQLLSEILQPLEEDFLSDLALICKTHGEELANYIGVLKTNNPYEQSKDSNVNLLYAAAILRTADLLHVNSERAPRTDFLLLSPKNPYSRREWGFQKSIKQIRPKSETNKEKIVDTSIPVHRFEMIGTFKNVGEYSRFLEYYEYALTEIRKTYEICKESQRVNKNDYFFPWDDLCKDEIKTVNFDKYKLKFELDHDKVFKLLIGHTLYSQANVVLRELTQNAIDAVRLMTSLQKSDSSAYTPTVRIEWNSGERKLIVRDNGTGMTTDIIKNYLLKVGISRYRTDEFTAEHPDFHSISHFGIGILTCFMISEDIDIITHYYEEPMAHSLHIRNHQGEYFIMNNVESKEILDDEHGSTFILKVRDDVELVSIEKALRSWILFPECKVFLSIDGEEDILIGYESEDECFKSFLKKYTQANNPKYKIASYEENGIKVTSLLYLNETYNIYTLCRAHDMLNDPTAPIGICIEGVLVSNNTPGYNDRKYISIVNCTGKESPSTNVARDRLEEGAEYSRMCKIIYKSYFNVIAQILQSIGEKYSDYWATSEASTYIEDLYGTDDYGAELVAEKEFEECLKREKCIIIDNGKESKTYSFSTLPAELWTIESQAYSHAVKMIQDIQRCSASPLNITSELQGISNSGAMRNVYADCHYSSYVTNLFVKSYQIQEILIYPEHRRLEIKWSHGRDKWHVIQNPRYEWNTSDYTPIFVQYPNADIDITNQDEATVLCTSLGLILLKGCMFNSYFNELLFRKDPAYSVSIEILSRFFIRFMRGHVKKEEFIDRFFDSDQNTLGDDIWKYLDKEKIQQCISEPVLKKIDFSVFYRISPDYDDYFL